jgi:hypothetical protein
VVPLTQLLLREDRQACSSWVLTLLAIVACLRDSLLPIDVGLPTYLRPGRPVKKRALLRRAAENSWAGPDDVP